MASLDLALVSCSATLDILLVSVVHYLLHSRERSVLGAQHRLEASYSQTGRRPAKNLQNLAEAANRKEPLKPERSARHFAGADDPFKLCEERGLENRIVIHAIAIVLAIRWLHEFKRCVWMSNA
jgi:hypothetical protein